MNWKIDLKTGERLFPKAGLRENNLDFIRFFLAIMVLYCHCFVMYYGTEDTVEPLWVASRKQSSLGSIAVDFFFMISGFLIFQSWDKSQDVMDFMKKRVLRIFPGFIMASALCLYVFAPLGTADHYMRFGYWRLYFSSIDVVAFLRNMVMLQEPAVPWTLKYVPIADTINAPLWTIRYEFICYLLVPFLALFKLYKYKISLILLFVGSYSLYLLQDYFQIYLFDWTEYPLIGKPDFLPRFFTYFFSGMIFYQYKASIPRSRLLLAVSVLAVLGGVFVWHGLNAVLPIFGTYMLFYGAFTQTVTFRNFTKAGDFSYGIYVYAWPVQQLVIVYFEKYLNVSLMFILSVMFTLPLAWLSWHYIEKPFLNFKKKKKVGVEEQQNSSLFKMHLN